MRKRWMAGASLGAVGLLLAGCVVANPGEFTTTVLPESSLQLTDNAGTPTVQFPIGVAACSDGLDNDVDGQSDFGPDPECDGAADANERVDGVQEYQSPTWVMNVEADGAIAVDPASMQFQPIEACFDTGLLGIWCMNVTIVGTGSTLTGKISPADMTIDLDLRVNAEIDGVVGFPDLSSTCAIGPISGTLHATDYDKTTGEATLTGADMPVPEASGCGSSGFLDYDSLISSALSLPGQADLTLTTRTLDGSGAPVS